jgi:hypothetical protein
MNIDLGDSPVGTPPNDSQKEQILSILNAVKGSGITNITAISRTDYDNLPVIDSQTLYIVDENA